MNKEEILAKAQNETDERELSVKNIAYKHASGAMALVIAVLALFFVVDGYLLENVRQFTSMTLGSAMIGIYCVYAAVYEGYVGFNLKENKNIIGSILMAVVAATMFTLFLSNII